MATTQALPHYLRSFSDFADHVRDELGDETSTRKGTAFSRLAATLLPSTDAGRGFVDIEQNPRLSHDKGIDALSAVDAEGRQLLIQAKLTLDRKAEVDSILSQFQQYEEDTVENTEPDVLFSLNELGRADRLPYYVIVTLSDPSGVMKRYKESRLATRDFCDNLEAAGRLVVVGGRELYEAAKREFTRSYMTPTRFTVSSPVGWLSQGNVRIGIVPATDLRDLYATYGDGLFFENIRSFLGLERNLDRETVNRRIQRTIESSPAELLARNNGITIRASKAHPGASANQMDLERPSIVNGCQTTMCVVTAPQPDNDAYVTVKVVEADDAWEVTHAANYQNRVRQIDLDTARFLRPQLVERVATMRGIVIEKATGRVQALLSEISASRVAYDEVKYLYRGLFSMRPNDLFDNNYNKLRSDVLEEFHQSDEMSEWLFQNIFVLIVAAGETMPALQDRYSGDDYRPFERYGRPSYKAYLTLLAAAGAVRMDLDRTQQPPRERAEFLRTFLEACRNVISDDPKLFKRTFTYAYQNLIETGLAAIDVKTGDAMISQKLHQLVSEKPFSQAHRQVLVRLDGEV